MKIQRKLFFIIFLKILVFKNVSSNILGYPQNEIKNIIKNKISSNKNYQNKIEVNTNEYKYDFLCVEDYEYNNNSLCDFLKNELNYALNMLNNTLGKKIFHLLLSVL